ncbi:MAG TPA: hypothetical protein VLX68_05850 [Chitinivibrionales bacterium]|nr:hypothetical protein [Chitinivibrionales bacterium]
MKTMGRKIDIMKRRGLSIAAVIFIAVWSQRGFCQNNVCAAHADANGVMTSMTVTNPLTSLQIEQQFDFFVDNQGNPTRGVVKFKRSTYYGEVERELNRGELRLLWEQFGGPQEYWDNAEKNGKIISYASIDGLPQDVFGKKVRLFLKDQSAAHLTDYFGILSMSASHPESVLLNTGGAQPLQIDKSLIREIQRIK